jgi:hypothetical protein
MVLTEMASEDEATPLFERTLLSKRLLALSFTARLYARLAKRYSMASNDVSNILDKLIGIASLIPLYSSPERKKTD